ncbi:Noc2-domain-containing protein [Auriscalpium vulgare]|uniref:Noc2-domain-containing protein n=1 Tax=Auriscalpium vulgare TaxID=40419 RepID=A0ACB8S976_9AGAM|nr:Noc2-domain-containing protein [Auriscalpium vulgare]
MAKKGTKATRKFAASGQLQKTIQARRKHQQIQKKIQKKQGTKKSAKGKERATNENEGGSADDGDERIREEKGSKKFHGMSVDDFLGGNFMEDEDDEVSAGEGESGEEPERDEEDNDNQSFASVDELDDDEGAAHLHELSKLAEKDPEFFKYLQENDRELLDFDPSSIDVDSDGEDATEGDGTTIPILTKPVLQKWQKTLLEQRSLRALRKLLVAFRAAALMNDEDKVLAWTIDSPSVYDKLVRTALVYTPIILDHHVPYKTLANGKFKAPAQTKKMKALQKLILSYFHNVIAIVGQLSDPELVKLAMTESAKLIPYIVSSHRTVKAYLKTCLHQWSTADDTVRIAAFLAIRKLASATDESILDLVLKSTYQTLVSSSKSTSAHTLPSITLMKNSASEIFCLDHGAAYQHAFGYIRQLAIHLRNSMKIKTKESYKQVYNWQYVHCVDFWTLVLARACDVEATAGRGGKESDLQPLIYPLVQVSTGAIKLLSHSRSYPFHLHIVRSLTHLSRHTHTYIPLAPYLLPILTSTLTTSKPKSSTLRPLDFDTAIRAPAQYVNTRVYAEGVADAGALLLAEWMCVPAVHASIAFPELVVPLTVVLRKALKAASKGKGRGGGKAAGAVKVLVERIEESAAWAAARRAGVVFAPGQTREVAAWEAAVEVAETPLGRYVQVQRKAREKQRQLVEKARRGEGEMLEEDDE